MPDSLDVTVRGATPDDVPQMSRVFVDTFRAAHRDTLPEALLLDRTYETSARGWARTLQEIATSEQPDEHVLVAVEGSTVVGMTMGGPARPWPPDDPVRARRPTAECYLLYVDVPRQGRQVGRALLTELARVLASDGARRMLVGVLASNVPARAFYERLGGELVGERELEDVGVLLREVVYAFDLEAGWV